MAGRRHILPSFDRRPAQSPGMMRHGPLPGYRVGETLPPPELLENKIAYQAAEIKQLAGDNHRLAASQVELRQELLAAEEEVQTVKAHMRSIQTESDIQIRAMVDKIAKKEVEVVAGEVVKKELQKAQMEAYSLVEARKELRNQIRQATDELQKTRVEVKKLPDLHDELEILRQEHHRLCATFEYEKGRNIEEVEHMKSMEKNIMGMAGEVERLRAEALNAEKRAQAPNAHNGGNINPDSYYTVTVPGASAYFDGYGRPYVSMGNRSLGEGIIHFASSSSKQHAATARDGGIWGAAYNPLLDTASGGVTVPTTGNSVWGGAYDSALARE
ncbi:protein FLX-like 4 isoform X1 [Argentina anserina]|uniref:protein FLX-like 4 isoform X1 n=1 Tax=Argentina anserina TaxID=57926 RepID=UPI0021766970|nr:protein FLX-like 4 isoform X1 [Potentilla anserina]XP_050387034.1 protein FLX-like 4 isoform X1 [Potentilla anserina]